MPRAPGAMARGPGCAGPRLLTVLTHETLPE
jgi:hypothetical protein